MCTSQDTEEWFTCRIGKVTASRLSDAMAKLSRASKNGSKGDWAAAHLKYVSELAWGMITQVPADHYVSKEMDLGKAFERKARGEYQYRFGEDVDLTGFVLHPDLNFFGASPDGLCGTVGGVEIKVPKVSTHQTYIEADAIPEEYYMQMIGGMCCCTDKEPREWWDFVSFCPASEDFGYEAQAMPDEMRMFRKRLHRDEVPKETWEAVRETAILTMEEALAKVHWIRERYPQVQKKPPKEDLSGYLTEEEIARYI